MKIQITAPVMPSEAMQEKMYDLCQETVSNPDAKVKFYQYGADSYGVTNFSVMVLNDDNSENNELQGKVMTAIFTMLFN